MVLLPWISSQRFGVVFSAAMRVLHNARPLIFFFGASSNLVSLHSLAPFICSSLASPRPSPLFSHSWPYYPSIFACPYLVAQESCGTRLFVIEMARIAWLVALCGLFLLVTVSARHQVLQWGQQPIRPTGSFVNQAFSSASSFGEPEWLPVDILGAEEVDDIRAGPSGSLLWKSVSGKWFLSGAYQYDNGGAVPNFYYPTELDFKASTFDTSLYSWNLYDVHFPPTTTTPGTPATTNFVSAFGNSATTPTDWLFQTFTQLSPDNPTPFTVTEPITSNLTCVKGACAFVASGNAYIYGYFSNGGDPMLGPEADGEDPAILGSALKPKWSSIQCGNLSSIPNTVTDVHVGLVHMAAVAGPVPGVSYQTINLWGYNTVGQLGNSDLGANCGSLAVTSDYFPGLPSTAKLTQFSVGSRHNLALFSNGMVYGFGDNSRGQLGVSPEVTGDGSSTPIKITFPGNPTIVYVSAWGHSSFAADSNGVIYAWGSNSAPSGASYPTWPISVFDEAIGVLGFGSARPALSYLSTPTRMSLPLPTGAKLLKIAKPYLWGTEQGIEGRIGDFSVNFIFDVPTPVTYTSPRTPNDPYRKPVAIGDTVLMTWGSPNYPGVANFAETRPVPRPVPADFPRSIDHTTIGDITTSAYMVFIQNNASNDFWYFGQNQGRLPADGIPSYIPAPYSSANTSEGVTMPATLRSLHTSTHTIYYNPSSPGSHFTCVPLASSGSNSTFTYLTSSDYASTKRILNIVAGTQHFIIHYADETFQTCTGDCNAVPNGGAPYLGRPGDLSKCGYGTALANGIAQSAIILAAGDSMSAAWACNGVGSTCSLSTWGSNALGTTAANTDGTRNYVDISGVALGSGASWLAIRSLECGYHFCAALRNGDIVFGWGEIPKQNGDEGEFYQAVTLIDEDSFSSGETIVQMSAVSKALFILTNKGHIYGLGRGQSGGDNYDGYMTYFPFLESIVQLPSNQFKWLMDLQKVNGVYYNYTRLMNSTAFEILSTPMVALGYAIAEPAPVPFTKRDSEYAPSSASTDNFLYAWGTNVGDTTTPYSNLRRRNLVIPTDDATSVITTPTLMFAGLYSDYGSGLPFDPLTANFTWSTNYVYALTPTGDVYYWGTRPFSPVHPEATFYDAGSNGPMLLMKDVAKIAALDEAVVFLQNDGIVSCFASPQGSTACYGASNSTTNANFVFYYEPAAQVPNPPMGAFTDIACSSFNAAPCVALWNNAAYLMTTSSGFGTPTHWTGQPTILKVWIAGANINNNTAPYYHWVYNRFDANANTDLPSLGWSSYADGASVVNYVGIDAANVSKIVVGAEHVLVLLRNGSLVGWGWTSLGQLGYYDRSAAYTAVPVFPNAFGQGLIQVADIGAANYASMVLTTTGHIYTWGSDAQTKPTSTSTSKVFLVNSLSTTDYSTEYMPWNVVSSITPKLIASNPNFAKLISGSASGFTGSFPTTITRCMVVSRGLVVEPTAPPQAANPVEPPTATPSVQCPPPRPSLANCVIFNGKYQWVVTQASLAANNRTVIVISNNVLIDGDLNISDDTPIQLRPLSGGDLPLINVTGNANLTSAIVIKLDDDDVKAISKKAGSQTANTTVLEASTLSLSTSASSAVKIESSAKKCRKVSSKTSETNSGTHSGLTTLISVNSGSCNNWWIILVSVVGGIIVLVAIFLIVYLSSPKVQSVFRPYKGTDGRHTTTTNLS